MELIEGNGARTGINPAPTLSASGLQRDVRGARDPQALTERAATCTLCKGNEAREK